MRARRLSRLVGLVLALAFAIGGVTGASGGFTTMEYTWGAAAAMEYTWGVAPVDTTPLP